ncbi:Flp family type IVb pilin [Pimelobacter simplex]|uniref:Flp family type IVb pilin n=1 Tax=Nocardioides simplex TaxID=2045 RepID=UPI00215004C3|nr:Flp family type IVb pilin [Pimelobacter simplex]UUW87545.1 Flp family type IVb pilin [Pimelobacter simplex]UUW97051.1 Flp family type IVb pilin [Pimelobacter simplex]
MTGAGAPEERGASAVEYGLLIALIAAVIFGAVILFGGSVAGLFDQTNSSLDSAISP